MSSLTGKLWKRYGLFFTTTCTDSFRNACGVFGRYFRGSPGAKAVSQGGVPQFHIAVTAVLAGVGGVPVLGAGGILDGNDIGVGKSLNVFLVGCSAFAGKGANTGCSTGGGFGDFPGVVMFMDGRFCCRWNCSSFRD